MTTNLQPLCSDIDVEPLPGTAKTGSLFIALEHAHGWGHDILDGHAFGADLTAALKKFVKENNAQLQLIRKPGREGQTRSDRAVFIARAGQGAGQGRVEMQKLVVQRPSDLLNIDLSAPQGVTVTHPVLLVCTHGKRDRCCAIKGRPQAAYLRERIDGDKIWESSHTKGHRFAPSIITLPWGYSFGRLNNDAALDMYRHFERGELFLPGNRGRSCFSASQQVAELAVAHQLVRAGETVAAGSLHVGGEGNVCEVVHPDGRTWTVRLEKLSVPGVVSSCGDAPKTGSAWKATEILPSI